MEKYAQLYNLDGDQSRPQLCKNCETKIRKHNAGYPELCCLCRPQRRCDN